MLPPELWHKVIKRLRKNPVALSALCLVDNHIYSLTIPILYRSVILTNRRAATRFLRSISTTTRSLGDMTTSLRVGEFRGEAVQLRNILLQLVNLRKLHLSDMWRVKGCLDDLSLPFSLVQLSCQSHSFQCLWSFLRTQSSITELTLTERQIYFTWFITVKPVPSDILPNLKKISGPMYTLAPFFQNRSISEVVLAKYDRGFINRDLVQTLSQSPLESITSFEGKWEARWLGIMEISFRENLTFRFLKRWNIIMDDSANQKRRKPPLEPCIGWLSRFEALEEFTIDRARGKARGESILSTKAWLGEFARAEAWRQAIRNIRIVRIYEEVIIA